MTRQTNYARSIFLLLFVVCLILVATILKVTASFCIPLTISILLSFVFYPLCQTLNKKLHIPWVLCIALVLLVSFVMLYFIGTLLISSTKSILSTYPKYESRFMAVYKMAAETFKFTYDEDSSLILNLWNSLNIRTAVQNFAIALSSYLVSFSKVLTLVTLFIIFLLLELDNLKKKVDVAFTEKEMHTTIVNITKKTISEVTHFISIKFIISLLTGLSVFFCAIAIKMDFPIIWGFMAFILNFIPNFGSITSWCLTTVFAVLQFYPSLGQVIFVSIIILVINMVLGNFIEPRWEGTDLGISPFIILVSLSFWGWMWGFVGMILAVPLTVIIKIICENFEVLKPIAILMGSSHKK